MKSPPKNIVITGATSGIGRATAMVLAEKGHQLGLIGRSAEKLSALAKELKSKFPNGNFFFYRCDLSSQEEIRANSRQILLDFPVLDVLINNAGIFLSERKLTSEGIEMVFAVNHLAYFLLTHCLMPCLSKAENARIICLGSDSHKSARINLTDPGFSSGYNGLRTYGHSKLANLMFVREFARQCPFKGISSYCIQPGLVHTDIGMKHSHWLWQLGWKFRRWAWGARSANEGAATSVFLATDPEIQDQTGLYWKDCRVSKASKEAHDNSKAKGLWELSLKMCGIQDYWS